MVLNGCVFALQREIFKQFMSFGVMVHKFAMVRSPVWLTIKINLANAFTAMNFKLCNLIIVW